jgi:hypothetical protein
LIFKFLDSNLEFFLEWKILHTKIVEKIKTHILCSTTFFFENRAVYEMMWYNILQPERSQMTIWRMRIACWITKATNTNSERVNTYCFSTATMVKRTSLNITSCLYCLSCYLSISSVAVPFFVILYHYEQTAPALSGGMLRELLFPSWC